MSTERRRRRHDTSSWERPSRYDIVLALIPATLLLTGITAVVLNVKLPFALAAGSVMATAAVVDALFVNPPTGGTP